MTTCPRCPATWTGTRTCHCGACHQTFTGVELFDWHRNHDGAHGHCLNPAAITDTQGRPRMELHNGRWRGAGRDVSRGTAAP